MWSTASERWCRWARSRPHATRQPGRGCLQLDHGSPANLTFMVQDALKFARHSKRTKLTTEDVSNALRMRNVEVSRLPAVVVPAATAALELIRDPRAF